MKPLYVITNPADNVAITTQPIALGTELMPGVVAREEIPQAHKIALEDIPKGGIVRRYNVVIGYAKEAIAHGSWINEFMLDLPQSPDMSHSRTHRALRGSVTTTDQISSLGRRTYSAS